MASINKKIRKQPEFTASIYGCQFEVQEDRKAAQAIIEYEIRYSNYQRHNELFTIRVPLISLWQDPLKNVAVKAHLKIDRHNPDHYRLFKSLMDVGRWRYHSSHAFTPDRSGVIRYGTDGDVAYHSEKPGEFAEYQIFDSKGKALADLIQRSESVYQIGGLSLINLDIIPESVLNEMGYEAVPDLLGRGVQMWMGSPKSLLDSSSSRYDYSTSSKRQENIKSFLSLVANALAL